jgi:hypothetical protein
MRSKNARASSAAQCPASSIAYFPFTTTCPPGARNGRPAAMNMSPFLNCNALRLWSERPRTCLWSALQRLRSCVRHSPELLAAPRAPGGRQHRPRLLPLEEGLPLLLRISRERPHKVALRHAVCVAVSAPEERGECSMRCSGRPVQRFGGLVTAFACHCVFMPERNCPIDASINSTVPRQNPGICSLHSMVDAAPTWLIYRSSILPNGSSNKSPVVCPHAWRSGQILRSISSPRTSIRDPRIARCSPKKSRYRYKAFGPARSDYSAKFA